MRSEEKSLAIRFAEKTIFSTQRHGIPF